MVKNMLLMISILSLEYVCIKSENLGSGLYLLTKLNEKTPQNIIERLYNEELMEMERFVLVVNNQSEVKMRSKERKKRFFTSTGKYMEKINQKISQKILEKLHNEELRERIILVLLNRYLESDTDMVK